MFANVALTLTARSSCPDVRVGKDVIDQRFRRVLSGYDPKPVTDIAPVGLAGAAVIAAPSVPAGGNQRQLGHLPCRQVSPIHIGGAPCVAHLRVL